MFPDLAAVLAPPLIERLALLVNHVLASEPEATRRLLAHRGRIIRFEVEGWPRLLPPLPVLAFRVTPAGLVEWDAAAGAADLRVRISGGHPAAVVLNALSGMAPPLDIEGNAEFATDADWLAKNLRWDLAADLERVFGPAAAHEIERIGTRLAAGLRAAVEGASSLAERMRPR